MFLHVAVQGKNAELYRVVHIRLKTKTAVPVKEDFYFRSNNFLFQNGRRNISVYDVLPGPRTQTQSEKLPNYENPRPSTMKFKSSESKESFQRICQTVRELSSYARRDSLKTRRNFSAWKLPVFFQRLLCTLFLYIKWKRENGSSSCSKSFSLSFPIAGFLKKGAC